MTQSDPLPLSGPDAMRQLRALELELEKTRNEAQAAVLKARAVELELQIARLNLQQPPDHGAIASWQDLRERVRYRIDRPHRSVPTSSQGPAVPHGPALPHGPAMPHGPAVPQGPSSKHGGVRMQESLPRPAPPGVVERSAAVAGARSDRRGSVVAGKTHRTRHAKPPATAVSRSAAPTMQRRIVGRKRRPAAWMVSAAVHLLVLLMLAFWTFSSGVPRDQISLSAAVAEPESIAVESLSLETAEVELTVEEAEPIEVPTQEAEIVGVVGPQWAPVLAAPATEIPHAETLLRPRPASATALMKATSSEMKMEFCGIEGGGNHFVYLVDSSASMGDAFDFARAELLRSIELLDEDQRFYVIFFDEQTDYMRLRPTLQREPRSVYATAENKAALRRWAKTIEMDRGRAPYEALPFAIDLRPDVIFLLSDGEFPARIEQLLGEINHVENLFGDQGSVSIVHTIGYHSRQGEQRMRRIAQQHGGRYRHVPAPSDR